MRKNGFNTNWTFYRADRPDAKKIVSLPHDAMLSEPRTQESAGGANIGYFEGGDYVYERAFILSENLAGKDVIFEFEGVYRNAEIFLNDEPVTVRPYGYTNFYVDVTSRVIFGKRNVIKVVARNSEQPNSRWYSGSGIYRPVWLYVLPSRRIMQNGIKVTTLDYVSRRIKITVDTSCDGEVSVTVVDRKGRPVSQTLSAFTTSRRAEFITELPDTKLWSPSSPSLYRCVASFGDDDDFVRFGIRQIDCTAVNGLLINGEKTILRGCCIHHDNGLLGAVAHPFAERRKIELLMNVGYNAIRSAHNPCSKSLLDACDELGMLVLDEFCDMWYVHKTKYDYATDFESWHRADLAEMVDKDFNHPSVIMYSIGNEVGETAQRRGVELCREMRDIIREKDTSRPVTCGINLFFNYLSSLGFGVYSDKKANKEAGGAGKRKKKAVGSEFFNELAGKFGASFMKFGATLWGSDRKTRKAFAELDVAGYNYGVERYKKDVKKYPKRVILGTETFCSDAYKFIEFAKTENALIGDFVWAGMDYLGEVGIGAWEYDYYADDFTRGVGWLTAGSGRLDITGRPWSEVDYTRVAFELEDIKIGVVPVSMGKSAHSASAWRFSNALPSWSWKGMKGADATVEVYCRAAAAELYVNGRRVGVKRLKNGCRAVFKTKYEDGEVTAVAYNARGMEIAKTSLKTAGDKTELRLCPELDEIRSNELSYVRARFTDANGEIKPLERGEVKLEVSGGKLLAFGNGCSFNKDGYLLDKTSLYFGEALAIIEPDGVSSEIRVRATSDKGEAEAVVYVVR